MGWTFYLEMRLCDRARSRLWRFTIYVGHMLTPRLLHLAVQYWTTDHGSG